MKSTVNHPCGCKSTNDRWVELCPDHKAEDSTIHQRWAGEYTCRRWAPIATSATETPGDGLDI